MAKVSSGARVRGGLLGLALLAAVGGWGQALAAPVEAGNTTQPVIKAEKPAAAEQPFGVEKVVGEQRDGNAAIVVYFNRPLKQVQAFSQLLHGSQGERRGLYGNWGVSDDGKSLIYPNVAPKGSYKVRIDGELLAADGSKLVSAVEREVEAGGAAPALSFASTGSVLPARGSRGLPVVFTNVESADIEFYRVHEASLSSLFCLFPRNTTGTSYGLSSGGYINCAERSVLNSLSDLGTSVYANHYKLNGKTDVRTQAYIPIQTVPQLAEPGVYMAVMKQAGNFNSYYSTSIFYVSDLGLHVRLYDGSALLHVASLQTGKPLADVEVRVDNQRGATQFSGKTDKDGNLLVKHKIDRNDVLIAKRDKEISVLPFNRPALDVSNFDISGRPQAPVEIFSWASRDLYRPGETPNVAALLRDFDGKALPAQALFARLVQPDGRKLADVRVEPKALNQFEWSQAIASDAPTGSWQLEWRLDPASSEAVGVFNFQVEEFMPERLKLELSDSQPSGEQAQAFDLKVQSSYLYGSPAAGNRFTARLVAQVERHPLASLPDTYFGDPYAKVNSTDDYAIDTPLSAEGTLQQGVALPDGLKADSAYKLLLSASVYETGGRAVTRSLSRVHWPASELVGIKPLFDIKQGPSWRNPAKFEIVRANRAGELLAGSKLKVRLFEEDRYSYWFRERGDNWQSQDNADLNLLEEREVDVPAGQALKVEFPVYWGSYRVQVFDPQTNLTTTFPFFAGYSWEDENAGKEARPDKVKVALDKTAYRAGDTLNVTVTPPQEGQGLLLVESDHLLYSKPIVAKAGATFAIPVTEEWEREDVHVVVLVFRGGSAKDLTTPARAIGIEHVTMQRNDRRIGLTLSAPAQVKPLEPLEVTVQADGLAGKQAYVRLTAVDQGVLNITNYPVPDAWTWLFSKRAMSVEAYDLYGRVIEAIEGATARLSYGGDSVNKGLPKATRLNPRVLIADVLAAPVQFDAQGKAVVRLDIPDFNGSLRVTALAYGEQSYGNASTAVIVRAPLLVEPSMPRVMTGGDQAQISLDVKNFSGKSGLAKISVRGSGLIEISNAEQSVQLEDGAGTTLRMPVLAQPGVDIAKVDIVAEINDFQVQRHFEFAVRSGWPQTLVSVPLAIQGQQEQLLDTSAASGLYASTLNSQLSLSTMPPLPYRQALQGLRYYPYGCIEQTTSGGYAALVLDDKTRLNLNIRDYSDRTRSETIRRALARIASFQASNGHFTYWGGDTHIVPYMTPYVVDFILDARDAGFAIPEAVLQKSLETLSKELISGDEDFVDYTYRAHMNVAYRAYAAFVLARVNRASLGTLRSLYDNQRQDLVSPLPLVHLGIALKLMGDTERGQKAIADAFAFSTQRPFYVGDYGSELRDLGLMVALTHTYGLSTPAYDARLVDWARSASARVDSANENSYYWGWSWNYLSTQEQLAIARVFNTFNSHGAPLAVSLDVGGKVEQPPANATVWTRPISKAELDSGVKLRAQSDAPVFATLDIAGISEQPPARSDNGMEIERRYFRTDGTPWTGNQLKEGDTLIVRLQIRARFDVVDAMVTDLLPGGLEVENLNLSGPQAWANVLVDGVDMQRYEREAEIVHAEYRDDRYAAAVKLRSWQYARLFYLVRAVTPGTYSVPPPLVEDMYRPALRSLGESTPSSLTVQSP